MSDHINLARVQAALSVQGGASSDFDLNQHVSRSKPANLRAAAVLIPLEETSDGFSVVLTKRSAALKHHPGQIAFPGGKFDVEDGDLQTTALREANEEIGLNMASARILGALPTHETVTGFSVTPYVALLSGQQAWVPEPGEVEEVFSVPLGHLLTPSNFLIEGRMWQGGRRRYFTVPYGPYYIWGATARIMHGLAERMHP